MSDETPLPLESNWRVQMLVERLRAGPSSTIELQRTMPFPHVARQVWEMRHWYGMTVKTGRLPNGVAVYTLVREFPTPGDLPRPAQAAPQPVLAPEVCRFCRGSGCVICGKPK